MYCTLCARLDIVLSTVFCALVNILDEEETVKNSLDENRLKNKVEK